MHNWQVTDDDFYDLLGKYVETFAPSPGSNIDGSSYVGDYFYSQSNQLAPYRYEVLKELLKKCSKNTDLDQDPQQVISEEDLVQFLGIKVV